MSKIYTKIGDDGSTSLVGGTRISKSDPILDLYGTCDEFNAHIGALIAEENIPFLTEIQEKLFVMGSIMATPPKQIEQYWKEVSWDSFLAIIEEEIDKMSIGLSPLHSFILPQGSRAIAQANICRTVCRKMERKISKFCPQNPDFIPLLHISNRLSDFFFILIRFLHNKYKIQEKYVKMR